MSTVAAEKLKLSGNSCFQAGDYLAAEKYYTQAIIQDPSNPALFTNRALTRCRLCHWSDVITDCVKALSLLPSSLKAYTYLGEANLALGRPAEAFTACKRAYELALQQRSPSVGKIVEMTLRAKKEKWQEQEHHRRAREGDVMTRTLEIMGEGYRRELEEMFGRAEANRWKKREVPDWMVDKISFNIMIDPVVTKNGHSYERATLLEHLRRSSTDPLTREPLSETDLRPNLALREAIEDFLKVNGWAEDW